MGLDASLCLCSFVLPAVVEGFLFFKYRVFAVVDFLT